MQFKEMKAIFKVSMNYEDFNGEYKPYEIVVEIERKKSGAFAYGDQSRHDLYINDNWSRGYDTRYDGISTNKSEWLKYWVDFFKSPEMWGHDKNKDLKIELLSYKETIKNIAD